MPYSKLPCVGDSGGKVQNVEHSAAIEHSAIDRVARAISRDFVLKRIETLVALSVGLYLPHSPYARTTSREEFKECKSGISQGK